MRFDDDCHERKCCREEFDCHRRDECGFDGDFGCGCRRERRGCCGFFNIFRGCGRRHHRHHCDCHRRCCNRDCF